MINKKLNMKNLMALLNKNGFANIAEYLEFKNVILKISKTNKNILINTNFFDIINSIENKKINYE